MKRNLLVCGMLALGVVLSCARVEQPEMEEPEVEVVFRAITEEPDSKTVIQDTYHVYWSPGDEISLFYGNGSNGGNRFTARNSEPVAETEFSGSISTGSAGQYFWGVYPYDASNACDGSSVTLNVPDSQMAVSQSFAPGSFPSVARSDTKTLAFKNVCGGLCFTVRRRGISSVTFSATGNQAIAGTVKVGFGSDGKPAIVNVVNGKSTVTLTAPNGTSLEPGVQYYLSMLPAELNSGFTMSFETDDQRTGTFTSSRKQVIKRSVFGNIPEADANVSSWEGGAPTEGGGTESGFYLGIVGFNQQLYTCPIGRLDYSTLATFESFIDGLTSKSGTLLYYSVSESLGKLQNAQYPDDLASASLVTFTDGIDQGSSMMIDNYPGDAEYLEYLNNRLGYSSVAGQSLSAYSVGFKGSDVSNASLFSQNLQKLAIPSYNAYELSSLSAINDRLQLLAEQLGQKVNSYDLYLTIPGLSNGTRVRFTLDDVSSAAASRMYIEGTFNLSTRSLTDVIYHGLITNMGATVSGVQDGIFVRFEFKDLILETSPSINKDVIQQWNDNSSSGNWQKNAELELSIIQNRKSTVVLLNLDCSSSLSGQFPTLQGYVKSFIERLCEVSHDLREVSSVTLNKTSLSLLKGNSETLVANVYPDTAVDKTVSWASDNESVARVNQDGMVTAVGVGEANITVTTRDRGFTASCKVVVKQLVESISLDRESLEMHVSDNPFSLVATVLPEDASDKALVWNSTNKSVAAVDQNGIVTAVSKGVTTISVTAKDGGGAKASCSVTVLSEGMPSAIDLGLSVKWASFNLGATKPEEYGDYFAWGEIQPYYENGYAQSDNPVWKADKNDGYEWSSYILADGPWSIQKYNTEGEYGLIDNNSILDTTDDPARSKLGGLWRMPNQVELQELNDNCTWSWTTLNGNGGFTVTSKINGNSVFLPGAGFRRGKRLRDVGTYGRYWSSSLDTNCPRDACFLEFDSNNHRVTQEERTLGYVVRPVYDPVNRPVTSITIHNNPIELYIGDNPTAIRATILPENASDESLQWTSSITSIATVDSYGRVTAVATGTTTITAKANDGSGVKTSCTVKVYRHVESVSLNKTELTLNTGQTATLTATVLPSNASNKSVTWTSSNSEIATVNSSGKITGVSPGVATITVTTADRGLTATCSVVVNQLVQSISLDKTEIEMYVGDSPVLINASILPDNASNKSLTWSSSKTSVATVDENGLVTAIAYGTASITARSKDGSGINATCSVKVYNHVESISLNETDITVYNGTRSNLWATVLPSTGTKKSLTWTSSDNSVAMVSGSGQHATVKGVALGDATITVCSADGGKLAFCTVTVKEPIINGHELVDLGLSSCLKWATYNIGATRPEEFGDYFAWGETEPKTDYSWSTYRWCKGTYNSLTKYNRDSSYGTIDNKNSLDLEDDAARANWQGSWRMPTHSEWIELINICSWTKTTQNGVNGILGISKANGNSIFFPYAGFRRGTNLYDVTWCYLWSSIVDGENEAYYTLYGSEPNEWYSRVRCDGLSVRAVTE